MLWDETRDQSMRRKDDTRPLYTYIVNRCKRSLGRLQSVGICRNVGYFPGGWSWSTAKLYGVEGKPRPAMLSGCVFPHATADSASSRELETQYKTTGTCLSDSRNVAQIGTPGSRSQAISCGWAGAALVGIRYCLSNAGFTFSPLFPRCGHGNQAAPVIG